MIQYYHREGLALWLDKCIWGNECKSQTTDEQTQLQELKDLYKILLKPAMQIQLTQTRIKTTNTPSGIELGHHYQTTGFWLQLALPAELVGKNQTNNVVN